jgi:uncharacterized protein YidB (DUF937 family)
MGLLDQVAGALTGTKGAGVNAVLLQQLMSMLSKPGALSGLMETFQKVGLGRILESWVGSGKNLPISAAQVEQVFGDGTLGDLAAKAGLDKARTASALSGLLPQVIDKLSPQGAMPSGKDLGGLLASVGKLLG